MPVSLRAEVGLEARSPRQFKVRLTRVGLDTYLATPHLVAATELQLPTALSVMGTSLDLGPVRALMEQINAGVEVRKHGWNIERRDGRMKWKEWGMGDLGCARFSGRGDDG